MSYRVPFNTEDSAAADEWLAEVAHAALRSSGKRSAVLIHYEGNTATREKNLRHGDVEALCAELLSAGLVPIILDWDRRSPLPDGRHVFCPDADCSLWRGLGTGDSSRLAALIDRAALFVGIDSGPQKIAAAVPTTPAIGVWRKLHPINYITPAAHMRHLLPMRADGFIRGDEQSRTAAANYFLARYQFDEVAFFSGENERPVDLRHKLKSSALHAIDSYTTISDADSAWHDCVDHYWMRDLADPQWSMHEEHAAYVTRFRWARKTRPASLIEIGVRAGYSAHAFLSANPGMRYSGLDFDNSTHGGQPGALTHARQLLSRWPTARIEISDSQKITTLARAEAVHVDGDHSYAGCLHDLNLALTAAPHTILVDDTRNILPVMIACNDWLRDNCDWHRTYHPDQRGLVTLCRQ